jgi:hypothetical protein
MATILWIIAVVLVIAGIVQIFQGEVIIGIVLIVVGLLVGPGGVSIFATSGMAVTGALPIGGGRHRVASPRRESGEPPADAALGDPADTSAAVR